MTTSDKTYPNFAALIVEYQRWCKQQHLPLLSADELRVEGITTTEQNQWLDDFIGRWYNIKETWTMYFYTDDSPRSEINLAVLHKLDPTKQYLKHYDNLLFLEFILAHPGSTRVEKHQARKEVTICERKLKYWERQSGFDQTSSLRGVEDLKSKWNSGKGLTP